MGSQSMDLMDFEQASAFIGYDERHTCASEVIALFRTV